MKPTAQSFLEILQDAFEKRLQKNDRYSLRAFARDLKIPPARFYSIYKGRYGISRAVAKAIARRLELSPEETEFFCVLAESKHARAKVERERALVRLTNLRKGMDYRSLDLDRYKVVADWAHMAILELTYLKNFEAGIPWIANRLLLPELVVRDNVDRLKRLGLLKEVDNTLKASDDFTVLHSEGPSEAVKNAHLQILDKAKESLRLQTSENREYTNVIMATNRKALEKAKHEIKEFSREITQRLQVAPGQADAVYCLSVQFFELSDPVM